MKDFAGGLAAIFLAIAFCIGIAFGGIYVWSKIRVYNATSIGKAELARAEQNRQILVSQAKAEKDAAEQRADAIRIMGQAAHDFPEYRQQEFIGAFAEALREGTMSQIIYVPTEANIPLMEAGKR